MIYIVLTFYYLEPENILLNAEGHVVLTDFGTARLVDEEPDADLNTGEVRGRKNSFVGTAEYVCPELLKGAPAGFASDLWSLGCVVYTLLTGKPAFRGASEYLTFQKILKREFEFPPDFPEVARDFVDKLLNLDPTLRLGAYPRGFSELKSHPFFEDIDFDKINQMDAPAFRMSEGADPEDPELTIDFQDEKIPVSPKTSTINQDGKVRHDPSAKWKRFLLADEEIIKFGYVLKRKGLFSKRRMLILTQVPRFVYIDPESMEKKGEIPWSSSLWAEMKNESTFYIHTPKRTYYMQAQDVGAREWVDTINQVIKRQNK